MSGLTLQEALLTDEVRAMIQELVEEEVDALRGGRELREAPRESVAPVAPESRFAARMREKGLDPGQFGVSEGGGG